MGLLFGKNAKEFGKNIGIHLHCTPIPDRMDLDLTLSENSSPLAEFFHPISDQVEEALNMQQGALLYEGKAKRVYLTDETDLVIVDYKDDATAFNGRNAAPSPARARSTTA